MVLKKEPIRTCIVCRKEFNKRDLIRLFLSGKTVGVTTDKNSVGRGAYLCKNEDCLIELKKKKAINRTFKINFSEIDYDELIEKIKKLR